MKKAYIQAIRPKTLFLVLAPILLSSSYSLKNNQFNFLIFISLILASLLLQAIANVSNDLYDFLQGSDTDSRTGFKRVTQSKELSVSEVKYFMIFLILLSFLPGAYLVYSVGWPILYTGLISIFFAIAYTKKPFSLAYRGCGEILVILFFGLIAVNMSYYCFEKKIYPELFFLSLALGLYQTAVIVVNNIRDYESDKESNKKTLVVFFGKSFGTYEYIILIFFAHLLPLLIFFIVPGTKNYFLSLLLLPLSIRNALNIYKTKDAEVYNKILEKTAKGALILSILLSFSLLLK